MTLDETKLNSDVTSEQLKTRTVGSENNCSQNTKIEETESQEDESVMYFEEKVVYIEKSLESLVNSIVGLLCNDCRDATGHGIYLLQFRFPSN